ncbi:MAG TPA: GNAT family N-acetyltransferase [Pirellulaceae bacterium]|nr:GNAT family N-acetyltransferase [Pirellulaceae bacterium]
MIRYRPFRNTDPPHIAEIWRSQPPLRGLMQPMSVAVFDRLVLSKTYFDRHGLIVAVDDERPVGFVHAGFGPTADEQNLSPERGVTCMLMVAPHAQQAQTARELLTQSEDYLVRRGAKVLYGGCIEPVNPFYLGLYGGSEMPGVLASHGTLLNLFTSSGYREVERTVIMHRQTAGFRPVVDRQQMLVRKKYRVDATPDPQVASWWEACTIGMTERLRFELIPKEGGLPVAAATFWDIEPLASSWGVRAMGLMRMATAPAARRQGLATFLLGEAVRQLQSQGIMQIELQCMQHNAGAQKLYTKHGFSETDQGVVLIKDVR